MPSSSDSRASYHFLLGYQAELDQETELAIKEYQLALQTDPASNYLKARLAVLYFTAGDVPSAVRFADEVADVPGLDAQMLGQIGGMYAAAGKPDKALRLFNRAIEQEPQRSEHFFAKGLLQANQKQYVEAENTIRAGIKISPDSAVGYYYLGRIGVEARDFDKATTHFEQAVALNPAFEPAYVALGSVYEAKQDRDKAIGIYRRYLQGVNPKNRDIRHHLIRLQVSAKQYDEALRELQEMLSEDPSDLDAQLRMGLVYGEQKDYPKAIQQLKQILTVRPTELKVRDYLGYLYEETKDYDGGLSLQSDAGAFVFRGASTLGCPAVPDQAVCRIHSAPSRSQPVESQAAGGPYRPGVVALSSRTVRAFPPGVSGRDSAQSGQCGPAF
jgi:tetratricopeptide (TPR) repeat protein